MHSFEIGDRTVGPGHPAYVIAEAGSNHNGDYEMATDLIDVAVDAGADAVKFQTFRAKEMYVEESGPTEYLDDEREIYDIIESMEMPYEWIPKLHDYCEERGIDFLSTPFDPRSADELEPYVPCVKIASYTMSHHPFLRHLADMDVPLIMSTGAHELEEVREAVDVLRDAGQEELALMQCVAAYPTPLESVNVRVVETLAETFDVPTGLSDHTLDPVAAPSAAVALGASVVEKHFTLDKSLEGPDHSFALNPTELDEMITAIRNTEKVLGSGEKRVLDAERELHDIARRRIHATRAIEAGETLDESNVAVLRSGRQANGLDPKFYDEVLGKTVVRDIEKDAGVVWDDIEK